MLGKVYLDALTHINNRTRVRDPNAPGVKEAKVGLLGFLSFVIDRMV